jgi:hypothetical protein
MDYLDLEEPIRDLSYMASIAQTLAWELLDGDRERVMDGGEVIIRAHPKDLERAIFAIQQTDGMAQRLDEAFQKSSEASAA